MRRAIDATWHATCVRCLRDERPIRLGIRVLVWTRLLHYPAISRRYLTISNHISLYLAISRISAISGTFTQPHPRDDAADSDAKSQKTRVLPEIIFGHFFEVLTTRNISLYLAVSYYISLYLTVSLISHHIRDGFCEQSRPGEG